MYLLKLIHLLKLIYMHLLKFSGYCTVGKGEKTRNKNTVNFHCMNNLYQDDKSNLRKNVFFVR